MPNADMDPNDHDTVHHAVHMPWVGTLITCRLVSTGRKTSTDWDKVTCRMCVFYNQLKKGAA